MEFLHSNEITAWCRTHRVELDAEERLLDDPALPAVSHVVYAESGRSGRESAVAAAAAAALGAWDQCLLWVVQWGVWPSSEDWPEFYAARGAHGERQSLNRTPGHLFSAGAEADLVAFLTLVLENAWDAHVLPAHGGMVRRRFWCSHDGWIELRSAAPTAITGAAV